MRGPVSLEVLDLMDIVLFLRTCFEGRRRIAGAHGGRLIRDQEVGGSNPLAPTNSFNHLQVKASRFLRAKSTFLGGQLGG